VYELTSLPQYIGGVRANQSPMEGEMTLNLLNGAGAPVLVNVTSIAGDGHNGVNGNGTAYTIENTGRIAGLYFNSPHRQSIFEMGECEDDVLWHGSDDYEVQDRGYSVDGG
jgi:hypothetical protein